MPFDPQNLQDLAKLDQSIQWSDERKRPHEKQVVSHIKQIVGQQYGDDGSSTPTPINMAELALRIIHRELSSHGLQSMCDTPYKDLQPCAADMELALNEEIRRTSFEDSSNGTILDSLLKMGIMKVGITVKDTPDGGEDYLRSAGHIFAQRVLLADAILDMRAKSWQEQRYIGHRYSVPREWVVYNKTFSKAIRDKIPKSAGQDFNWRPGDSMDRHAESLSQGNTPRVDDYEDDLILQELWLPFENRIIVRVDNQPWLPLDDFNWEGPDRGPYHDCCIGRVPGNVIPTGFIGGLMDLHDITNRNFVKASQQADRQKSILAVPGSAADDGERIVESEDGQAIYIEGNGKCEEYTYGGANDKTLAMALQAKALADYFGGNLSSLAGLGAQSRTVGQDELLANSASSQVRDMQETVSEFRTGALQSMAWWLWTDPLSDYNLLKSIEGTPYSIPIRFTQDQKKGRFFDYNFKVNPFSEPARSPTEKAQSLIQWVEQVLMPSLPMRMQQGQTVDWEFFDKTCARYLHTPEIARINVYTQGEQYPERGPVDPPAMPQNTTRTYNRVNTSGATEAGKSKVLISHLMGLTQQPAELQATAAPAAGA
jgi:hypothetical protein